MLLCITYRGFIHVGLNHDIAVIGVMSSIKSINSCNPLTYICTKQSNLVSNLENVITMTSLFLFSLILTKRSHQALANVKNPNGFVMLSMGVIFERYFYYF